MSEKVLNILHLVWHIIWSLCMIVLVVAYTKGMIEHLLFTVYMCVAVALLVLGVLLE